MVVYSSAIPQELYRGSAFRAAHNRASRRAASFEWAAASFEWALDLAGCAQPDRDEVWMRDRAMRGLSSIPSRRPRDFRCTDTCLGGFRCRMPRLIPARRRGCARNRIHARVARAIGDLDRPESPQRGDLLGVKPRPAVEPRDQEERQRLGHHELPGKRKKLSHN